MQLFARYAHHFHKKRLWSSAVAILMGFAIVVAHSSLLQAAPRPFDSVFSDNIQGDLVMAGNSNILQSAWMDNPTPASIDGDSTDLCLERSTGGELCRNNSSSALLDVPENARIIDARLYVQTTLNPDVEPVQVRIAGPDDGFNYATAPNAEISKLYEATAGTSPGNYPRDSMRSAAFDVTDLVQAQGGGDYTVADIVYERDGSAWMPYAGWTIMVAYEWDDTSGIDLGSLSPEEQYRYKLRSVSWSDGMLYQTSGTTTVTLDNFQVPDSGPRFGKTFHSVAHGQLGYADSLDFNGQPLGDNNAAGNSENPFETIGTDPMCNATTDVQNDTMCYLGSHVDTKNPGADAYTASGNNFTPTSSTSIDADVIRIPDSYLTPGLTTAEVDIRTIGDEWLTPTMLAISVDLPDSSDYGDAPTSYGTLLSDDGPRHGIPDFDDVSNSASLMLGEGISAEDDGQPSVNADADTFDDGVLDPIALTAGQPTEVDVVVTNDTNDVATLAGWIDQNANGTFEVGERVTVEVPANSGTTTQTLTFPAAALLTDDTYARFRVFPGPVADPQPTGVAATGEVEDYLVQNAAVQYSKTVSPLVTEITPGQTFTYTVTVENIGASDLTGLSFTDNLANVVDDATYNTDATADIGTAVFNAPDEIAWSGDLAVGQTATITYSVTMNDPVTGDGVLINSVVGDGPGSNCTDDPATDPNCTTTVPLPDVSSQKTLIGPVEPQPGDVVDYQFTITNAGDSAVTGVAAADDLSGVLDDATYNGDAVASSGTVTFSAVNERLNWNGDLAASGDPGDVVTVTYSVTVNAADELGDGVLLNALISPDCPNPPIFDTSDPDYDPDCVTENPIEAWIASKSVNPTGNVAPDQTVTYTINVENTGGVDLTGLSIDDDLSTVIDDAAYNNDGSATVGTVNFTSPTLTWNGDLAVDQTSTITYSFTINAADSLGDGQLANVITGPMNCPGEECETENLVEAWQATKTNNAAGNVQAGDTVTYSITVENLGGADLTGANAPNITDDLTEVIDDATYNNDESATIGTPTYAEPTLSWSNDLLAGESSTITYSVTVDEASLDGDGVMANAITGSPNCPSDDCETTTLVEEWIATKEATPTGTVTPGETINYTVTVENTGGADLTGLVVDDDLTNVLDDAAYNNDEAATNGAISFTSPTVTWNGDLLQDENAILSYSVTINEADNLGDGVVNNAVTGPMNCPGEDCETEHVIEAWVSRKTSDVVDAAAPGDIVTYTVEVENTGGADLTGLSVDDDLSSVLDDASYNNDEAATVGTAGYTEPTLSWEGDLMADQIATITYSVTVNDGSSLGDGVLTNAITGAPNCPADECSTEDPVEAWIATKAVTPAGNVSPGATVNYTIEVENTGGTDLTGISVDDDLSQILDDATYNNDDSATIGATSFASPTLNWTGDLAMTETSTITYSITVNDAESLGDGILSNVITGAPNCPAEECGTENLVEAWTTKKTSTPGGTLSAGDVVTYTVTVENLGGADVTPSVTDDLSGVLDDATYNNDASATIGTPNYNSPVLSWSGTLTSGQVSEITYSATVDEASSDGDGVLTNAIVAPGGGCADPAITDENDPSFNPDCVAIAPVQEWIATKTVTPTGAVGPEETLEYTITVQNTGGVDLVGADAPAITDDMTEVLDDATYNNDESATIGTPGYTEPVLDWSNDLLVGEDSIITYSVTANSDGEFGDGVLTNVIAGAPNCPAGECSTTTNVTSFAVEKTSNPEDGSDVEPGDNVTYTVSIENTGTLDLTNFSFTDHLEGVLNNATLTSGPVVSPDSAGVATHSGNEIAFTGDIPIGDVIAVSYSVQVNQDAPANAELRNYVTGEFSNCVTGEEPECLTTHTVVPPAPVLSPEGLAETGQKLLPFIMAAVALVATGIGVMKWRRGFIQ